jgi:DNA mismatch repair protein MutS
MTETAQILNGASRRSLVILDEVGRGTSTFDGVSIAWSVTEYLAKEIGARTLFATHYHELNTLETVYPQIRNARVCVTETEGAIEFLHRVEEGSAQKSYGIQVAKMAGLPSDVIIKASSLLSQMQKKALASVSAKPTRSTSKSKNTVPQMTLFEINIGN